MKQMIQTTALGLTLMASSALAAVPAERAAQLGHSLTPLGAEQAGNADGSIPAWSGGLAKTSGERNADGFLDDPYADEQPLFTIDAQNVAQYREKLSAGQLAMLQRYPKTYRLPIYPSHRSVALPESVYRAAQQNALNTQLIGNGNGLSHFETAYPFPIAQNGQEVIWNHITRYRGGSMRRTSVQATPQHDGTFTPIYFHQQFSYRDQLSDFDPAKPDNILFYFKERVSSPARLAGNVVLVHETLNQVEEPRKAWLYNAGQRRVRRAPQVAYDGPYPGSEGLRVADNFDMFNGALDRYDWQLIGKRELFIPYNSFKLDSPKLNYRDIVQAGHLNPDFTRYELHRVWVVEAKLKPGERHVYAKRTFYLDEDSWQIVLAEHYDSRGILWRAAEGHLQPYYDVQVPWLAVETTHDLINGRYIVSGMKNEEKRPVEFGIRSLAADYTPTALRNAGVR
ncbi:DUF1329 domain-containing protein [Pseudomonas zhanjiangensis]|uniref:DUF1329 domain-containing protein n=1 Tax=Pseudomonas zhanjiangensis TaxID=3239015 RepID=A0ABV3YTA6_9PSED